MNLIESFWNNYTRARAMYHKYILGHVVSVSHTVFHFRDLHDVYDYTCDTEIKYLGRVDN